MTEFLIPDFAVALEERYGEGIYRKIKVDPAEGPNGRKKPYGEKSNMSRADIINNRIGHAEWNNYSFSIKYAEALYVLDFDTKIFKNPAFFDHLRECGAYHTETVKGYHFFVSITGLPEFNCEINLANPRYFHKADDIDLIAQKRNIWEPVSDSQGSPRQVIGTTFVNLEWDQIKIFFNESKMNFVNPDFVEVVEGAEEIEIVVQGQELVVAVETCDEDTMRGYLARLSPERKNDSDDWLKVSMALYTNFRELGDLITGYELYEEFSQGGDSYNKKSNKVRWNGFESRPAGTPLTYKTIRKMADEDTTENVYESIYKSRGSLALVEYINETYIYNKSHSNIIYLDNGKHYLKKPVDMANDLEMYKFLVEDSTGKMREIRPDKIWSGSPKRRCVRAIDFDPSETRHNIYNLWKGYFITAESSQSADETMCQPLLDHLRDVWCSGNEDQYNYVLNWFAWVLQKPHVKIGVMLCIRSRQGGGKGTILEMFSHILDGERDTGYYGQCANIDSLIGSFNTTMEGKCCINFDEAFFGGDAKTGEVLKNLITESKQEIRVKHHKAYQIKNTTAFILTTNAERFSQVTKDDRRHMCLECDDSHLDTKTKKQSGEYFTKIQGRKYDEPQNQEMCSSWAKVLYARDISSFNPGEFPKTELAFNQIQQGWNSVIRYWYKVLNTGILWTSTSGSEVTIDGEEQDWGFNDEPGIVTNSGTLLVFKKTVFQAYMDTNHGGYNGGRRENESQFWVMSHRLFRDNELKPARPDAGHGSTRHRCIHFAPLDVLRKSFKRDQKADHLAIFDDEQDGDVEVVG